MPQKMRVSNHSEYNKFLEKRGNIFHYINEAIEKWYENGPKIPGGNNIYSDKVVILVHIITCLFRIGLRQTVGFIAGYLEQIGKNLQVISYSQSSRRFKKLNIKINDCRIDKNNMEDIEITIDSTGISIYNNTPGHSKENSEDRKYRSYEQTRKLHVMLNTNSKKAIAVKYSNGVYSDHYGACDLLKEVDFQYVIKVLYADRAYDREKLYKLCNQYGIKTKIPPKNNAAEHPKLDYMLDRNAAIQLMKLHGENGIKRWKEEVNYGKRSYIKGFFSRLKRIFGFSFRRLGKGVVLLLLPPLETQHAGFPTLRLSPLSKSFFSRTGLSFMIPQKTSFLMVTPTVENLLLRKSLLTFLFVSLFHQNTFSILSQVDLHPP